MEKNWGDTPSATFNESLANHKVTYMYFLKPVSGTLYIRLF